MIKTFLEKKQLATLVFFLLTLVVFIISKINLDKIDYWGAKNSIIALSFLYPPIFYFLIHEKLVGKITFSLKIVSHLFPFLLFTLIKGFFQLDYSIFEMPDSSLYTFTEELNPISLLYLFKEVQLDAYLVLDLHLIINYSKLSGLFKQYSQEIKFISIVYIAIIIRIILNKLFFKTFFFIDIHFNTLFILCLFGFIYFIIEAIRIFSFLVLEKSPNPLPSTLIEDFIEQQEEGEEEEEGEDSILKNLPQLSEEQLLEIEYKIQEYLTEYPTRDQRFNKLNLINRLEIPEYLINQYFNKHLNISFKDWKTQTRIMDSTNLIKEGFLVTHTVEALAKEVGFQSRGRFVQAFGKYNKCPPSLYLKENS